MSSKSSTIDRPLPDRVTVGHIRRPHGIAGAVLVAVESDVEDRFAVGKRLWVSPRNGAPRSLKITESRLHGDGDRRLRFEGLDDRDACDPLRGALLEVDRSEVPPAPEDTYYYFELEGCRCRDLRDGDLGEVMGVLEDGGGWILALEREGEAGREELLIPFVRAFLRRVDLEAREIELELPEGLVEACTSRS